MESKRELAKSIINTISCFLKKINTAFLGHLLTPEGIKPNPNKVEAIQKLKLPTSQKQIKSFLAITGFYRKFIKDYSKISYPMIVYLNKKNANINVNNPSYIIAFERLKYIIAILTF